MTEKHDRHESATEHYVTDAEATTLHTDPDCRSFSRPDNVRPARDDEIDELRLCTWCEGGANADNYSAAYKGALKRVSVDAR